MSINTYTVTWFRGKELNLVFGLQLSIARLGSTINFLVMEPLLNLMKQNLEQLSALGWTFVIAAAFTVLSFASSLLLGKRSVFFYIILDYYN